MHRLLPLRGGLNFRDLGGYKTRDGRRVRWRLFFRSGGPDYLTDTDRALVQGLGIRVICDLRTRREWGSSTSFLPNSGALHMKWDYNRRVVSLSMPVASKFTRETARAAMIMLYRRLPTALERQYAWLLKALAAGQVPLLVNCSAGKDRTGVAVALALTCLGISMEDVMADFCYTDQAVDLEERFFNDRLPTVQQDQEHAFVARLNSGVRAPLLKALPEYLDAAFDQIARDHGSVLNYVHSRLRITDVQIADLRTRLLEP